MATQPDTAATDTGAGFSLADLADINVDNIEEVRFQALPAGAYGFEVTESDLAEYEKDGERKFKAEVVMKIVEVKTVLEPGVDKESLVGKVHTERMVVDPAKPKDEIEKAIGRIRAFVADVGRPNTGTLGEIVRGLKGHVFTGKIVKQKDKDDKSIEYARLRLDPPKK